MKTVTYCGRNADFVMEIDEAVFDDMELIEDLAALDAGDGGALLRVTDRLLGPRKRELYDAIRDEHGRVPRKTFGEAMGIIIQAAIPKNV